MAVDIWIVAIIAATALFMGFWIGRSTERMAADTEQQAAVVQAVEESAEEKHRPGELAPKDAIASPATGEVAPFHEGRRRGARIMPEQGMVYAPVSGKVKKMYPMGNAMMIVSDKGEEILIRVCEDVDEIFSMYFRARVVQNEMINKGKLLLEFDKERLEKQGVNMAVSVSVDTEDGRRLAMTGCSRVKAGEALLWM